MGRISKKSAIAGLATAGVLSVGIAIPAIAFAEGAEPNASPSASVTSSPDRQADGRAEKRDWQRLREERKDALAEALAAELGVDKEKVAAALEKVRGQMRSEAGARHKDWARPGGRPEGGPSAADRQARLVERLDQAVADGKLTQEQADAIRKAAEAGVLNGPGWGGHRRR